MKPNPKQWIKDNVEAFENYLQDAHYDDDLPDHFNDWVSKLTRRELQDHANNMCLEWAGWITNEYIVQNFAPFEK